MNVLNTLKTATRAVLVATALGGTVMVGAAQAQPRPSIDFNLSFGNDRGGISFGTGRHGDRWDRWDRRCYSDRQVRDLVRQQGYRDVRVLDRRGQTVWLHAERGRTDYRLGVNACSGKIVSRDRVRSGRR